jgi:hypothetical protein
MSALPRLATIEQTSRLVRFVLATDSFAEAIKSPQRQGAGEEQDSIAADLNQTNIAT